MIRVTKLDGMCTQYGEFDEYWFQDDFLVIVHPEGRDYINLDQIEEIEITK